LSNLDVRPLVMAHRGDRRHAPENTWPAFAQAVACGADVLETDVQWTRDGVIVVCHDDTVDAVSDGSGRVADMTFAELKRLDFGYRFTPDGGRTYPYRGKGVRILSLAELLAAFPDARFNVEIKSPQPPSLARFVRDVCESRAERRLVVASFHHQVLVRLRKICPWLVTSASTCEVVRFLAATWLPQSLSPQRLPYIALQVPARWGPVPVVQPRFLRRAHAIGCAVHVWTVEDEAEMERWFRLGIDGLITDDPGAAVRVRERMAWEC
jgi:glycerophosphoryl diester phosphodiesterase